ncbi:hypothetical protein BDV19DRAFT_393943 [Aspergillus venezuelensis]
MMFKQLTTFLTASALLLPAALAAPTDIEARGDTVYITFFGNKDCYGGGGGTWKLENPTVWVMKYKSVKSFMIDHGLPGNTQLDIATTDDLDHWADGTQEVLDTACNKDLKSYTRKNLKKGLCYNTETATCWKLWDNKGL